MSEKIRVKVWGEYPASQAVFEGVEGWLDRVTGKIDCGTHGVHTVSYRVSRPIPEDMTGGIIEEYQYGTWEVIDE